jgi:tRNA-dihydrouridine synthase B
VSCETASNNATPPSPAIAPGAEAIDVREVAARIGAGEWGWQGGSGTIDPRIRALVPGFDAPFFQAGLAGYSDAAMRIIARRHGCPFCITEALLDRTLLAGGRGFAKADLGELEDNVPGGDEDHPLSGQIMGSDPREMAAAAIKMVEQGRARSEKQYRGLAYERDGVHPSTSALGRQHLRLPGGVQVGFWPDNRDEEAERMTERETKRPRDEVPSSLDAATPSLMNSVSPSLPSGPTFATIDVNLACPVKKIDRKARGGHWLAEPEGAIAILEAVREAVPREIPCTVKLRRSYDDTPEMVARFDRLLEALPRIGYAWAIVHARTVEQKYIGPSRWDLLKRIVQQAGDWPIFGSGDVWDASSIFRMIAYTGVSGVSVARGCIGNPWIFRQARQLMAGEPLQSPTVAQQREVLKAHFDLALKVNQGLGVKRPEVYTGRTMRKFGIRFAVHHPRGEEVRQRLIAVHSLEDWHAVIDEWYKDSV